MPGGTNVAGRLAVTIADLALMISIGPPMSKVGPRISAASAGMGLVRVNCVIRSIPGVTFAHPPSDG
jgi:hypothetical protein